MNIWNMRNAISIRIMPKRPHPEEFEIINDTENRKRNRNNGIEIARLFAAYAVVYGHFVWSGTFDAVFVRDLIESSEKLPLLSATGNNLWKLQDIFGKLFGGAHITVIGIALFFLISGYLTIPMQNRYTRAKYIVNRLFRIYPMLLFSTLMVVIIQYWLRGNEYHITLYDYFGTATTFSKEMGTVLINPVVWTLAVEIKFYILSMIVGKWTVFKLLIINILIILIIWVSGYIQWLKPVAHDLHFISFILIGIAISISETFDNWLYSVILILDMLVLFNVSFFIIVANAIRPEQYFTQINQIIAICIFFKFILISDKIPNNIQSYSNATYSLYLIHPILGYNFIAWIRHYVHNQYVILFIAVLIINSFALIAYAYIERPFIGLFKQLASLRVKAARGEKSGKPITPEPSDCDP